MAARCDSVGTLSGGSGKVRPSSTKRLNHARSSLDPSPAADACRRRRRDLDPRRLRRRSAAAYSNGSGGRDSGTSSRGDRYPRRGDRRRRTGNSRSKEGHAGRPGSDTGGGASDACRGSGYSCPTRSNSDRDDCDSSCDIRGTCYSASCDAGGISGRHSRSAARRASHPGSDA
jgi:hypothetical protein